MLHSGLILALSALTTGLIWQAHVERTHSLRLLAAAIPLVLELRQQTQCRELEDVTTPGMLRAAGLLSVDPAAGVFDWVLESATNRTPTLVISSQEAGLSLLAARFGGSIEAPNRLLIPIVSGGQMRVPELHVNVISENRPGTDPGMDEVLGGQGGCAG